jgi:hypothetical protein
MNGAAPLTTSRHLGPEAVLASYAVLLLIIPSRFTVGSFAVTAAMVVGLLAGALWLGGVLVPDHGSPPRSGPARRAVLVYLSLMVLSYLVAVLRPLDATAANGADRRLVGLLSVVGVALLAIDGLRDRRAIYRVVGVLVAAGATVACVGILQYVIGVDLARSLRPPGFAADSNFAFVVTRAGFDRVAGTARHPIEFGVVCASLVPIALHLAVHATRPVGRWASALAAGLLGLALPMALSRAAVLGVLAALAIMLPFMSAARRRKLIIGAGAVLVSITLLAPGILTVLGDLFFGRASAGSNRGRARAADTAFALFGEEPWLGHGFGTLGIVVDNQFLVTIVESGVLGIVAILVLGNGAILAARNARRATDDDRLRDLSIALIAVIAAIAIGSSGLATLVYPTTSGVLFLTVGLAGAVERIAADDLLVRVPSSTGRPGLAAVRS